jgi:hypothetical protein
MVSKCLSAGVVFSYGLMLDIANRRIADLRQELEFIISTPEITLPSFVTLSIPILGTPYFFECLERGTMLPRTKLRDMDGTTIMQRPLDSLGEAVRFVSDLQSLKGFHSRIVKHAVRFTRLYRSRLTTMQMTLALGSGLLVCAQSLTSSFTGLGWLKKRPQPRTFVSTTEPLDHMYTPAFRIDSRYEHYFKPTMVTDERGELHEHMINSGLLNTAVANRRAAAL